MSGVFTFFFFFLSKLKTVQSFSAENSLVLCKYFEDRGSR